MRPGTLTLLRGLPGSGKTSTAEYLQHDYTILCSADDYFYDDDGIYNFNPEYLGRAHNACLRKTRHYLETGMDVIVHNTFTTNKELKPYLKLAEELETRCISLIVENRHGSTSVHDVPDETLNKMRNRFAVKI